MSNFAERVNRFSPDLFTKTPYERNQIVYIPKFLCQASLPKMRPKGNEFKRKFADREYTFISPSDIGLPYGTYARLILIHLTTLAKMNQTQTISVGRSLADFMESIGLDQSGGGTGNILTFKENFVRCINCTIHSVIRTGKKIEFSFSHVSDKASLIDVNNWYWHVELTLSDSFYEEALKAAPTDLGAILCLKPGTLRMDIFNFLVYRLFYLKKKTLVPWGELQNMFASPDVSNKSFRQHFRRALPQALALYSNANVELNKRGLCLAPSSMLIQPR